MIELFAGLLLSAVTTVFSHARNRSRIAVWEKAAVAAGLEQVVVRRLLGWPSGLDARWKGLSVELSASWTERPWGTQIQVRGLQPYLGVKVARSPHPLTGLIGAQSILVGDEAFDRAMEVHGETSGALAVLDTEARRRLLHLFDVSRDPDRRLEMIAKTAELSSGRLSVLCPDGPGFERAARLARGLDEVLSLADRLRTPVSIDAALGANVAADAVAGVRLRNLDALLALSPDAPETRAVLSRAQDDADEAVALRAALALGPEGHAALHRLARADGASEDAFLRAVQALGASWSAEDAGHVLARLPETGRDRVAASCLASLAAAGGAHTETVVKILASARGLKAISAARALGRASSKEAEPALLAAIEHDDMAVRAAAAVSLGSVGTVRAVPPLRHVVESTWDRDLRRAARAAVASIQSRLVGAERGQLELASDGGGLSLADDADGRVSLKDAP